MKLPASEYEAWIRYGDAAITVDAHTIDVNALICENPACTCEALTLAFRETRPARRRAGLAFDISVDFASGAPPTVLGLGPVAGQMANNAYRDIVVPGLPTLRATLRDVRERVRTIDQTVAEYVRLGQLVPWAHVRRGGRPNDATYLDFLSEYDHDGDEWDVLDYVCANPPCACAEVLLRFVLRDDEGHPLAEFDTRVPLGPGAVRFEELRGISLEDARAVHEGWKSETVYDRAALRARYDAVRAAAARALAPAPRPALARATPALLSAAPIRPVGRREACPCGSGKRYKNCCERRER